VQFKNARKREASTLSSCPPEQLQHQAGEEECGVAVSQQVLSTVLRLVVVAGTAQLKHLQRQQQQQQQAGLSRNSCLAGGKVLAGTAQLKHLQQQQQQQQQQATATGAVGWLTE
jgi:hypothetical protein